MPEASQRGSSRRFSPPSRASLSVSPVLRAVSSRLRHEDLEGLSLQNRRLRLRNRLVRAPQLFPGSVNSGLDACSSRSHQLQSTENEEDNFEKTGESPEKTSYGELSPPSPLKLIRELSESTRRRRQNLGRTSLTGILESSTTAGDDDRTFTRHGSNESSDHSHSSLSPLRLLQKLSSSNRACPHVQRPSLVGILEDSNAVNETTGYLQTSGFEFSSTNSQPSPSPVSVLRDVSNPTKTHQNGLSQSILVNSSSDSAAIDCLKDRTQPAFPYSKASNNPESSLCSSKSELGNSNSIRTAQNALPNSLTEKLEHATATPEAGTDLFASKPQRESSDYLQSSIRRNQTSKRNIRNLLQTGARDIDEESDTNVNTGGNLWTALNEKRLSMSPERGLRQSSNSIKRRPKTLRPNLNDIFEDSGTSTLSERHQTSWYNEASTDSSPLSKHNHLSDDTMHLREGSLNTRTPTPICSPLSKQIRNRSKRSLHRSPSYDSTRYIDHLEHLLATTQTQLETYTSPTSTSSPTAKLRTLTKENALLRQEISAWETELATHLQERHTSESLQRAKIAALEHSAQQKDLRITELETDVDAALRRAKDLQADLDKESSRRVRDSDALRHANADLERRLEVLTHLLAASPTTSSSSSPPTGTGVPPALSRPRPRPRPRSMMPRIPSSSSSSSSSAAGPLTTPFHTMPDWAPGPSSSSSPDSSSPPPSSSSPEAPAHAAREAQSPRRMRRFPSGSCSLKPLVLPNKSLAEELRGVGEGGGEGLPELGLGLGLGLGMGAEDEGRRSVPESESGSEPLRRRLLAMLGSWRWVRGVLRFAWRALRVRFGRVGWLLLGLFFGP